MEQEGTPNILLDTLQDVEPVHELLLHTWRSLPGETLEAEQGRLRERLLDIGGRLVAITEIMEESNEHTVSA